MTALNKQALREAAEKASTDSHTQDEWFHYLRCSHPTTVLALLDELEAAQKLATQQGNIAVALLDEVTALRRNVDGKTPELRAQLIEADNELETLRLRITELEARQPYGYLRENDGQIQISIGSNRPHDRSGGYATPWFAIYTAAGIGVKGE